MILVKPDLNVSFSCPICSSALESVGWCISGTWSFADLACPNCSRQFFGELPVGLARKRQHLIDKESGEAWGPEAGFYSSTYARRVDKCVDIEVEIMEHVSDALILNCVDWLYGHSLLKLLNAQRHLDEAPGHGLIVMVPRHLRWLVPDGVAQVWTVDISPSEALNWNEGFANEVERLSKRFQRVWLSRALSHPHPSQVEISRFTRVSPFDVSKWTEVVPTITFVWRDDRTWPRPVGIDRFINSVLYRLNQNWSSRFLCFKQERAVNKLFNLLIGKLEAVEFSVVGLATSSPTVVGCDKSISPTPSPKLEREWCERYARSHVVIGVHGSNMLLPSAHAGAVVELLPRERWGNFMQDLIPLRNDARAAIYCYRNLSFSAPIEEVAECVHALVRDHDYQLDEFMPHPSTDAKPLSGEL